METKTAQYYSVKYTLQGNIKENTEMNTLQIENNMTREVWLNMSTDKLNDKVFKQAGYEVPTDRKVSCGFPASGGRSGSKNMTVGTCHNRASSKANVNEIYISPTQADSLEVLGILAHELIHAIDDCKNGHKGLFRTIAVDIGLEGKMTATTTGEKLLEVLKEIVAELGEYPHAEVSTGNKKKQGTRNIKVACSSCEFSYRTSQKNIDLMSNAICNSCGDDTLTID
tara:strand:+ start:437 stop:1114 length:678 start_codon:yes stop_codon:yes gene_type:complete